MLSLSPDATVIQCCSVTEMLSVLICNRDVVTAMSLSPDATVIQCCSVTEMLSVLLPYPNVIHAALSLKCCQYGTALSWNVVCAALLTKCWSMLLWRRCCHCHEPCHPMLYRYSVLLYSITEMLSVLQKLEQHREKRRILTIFHCKRQGTLLEQNLKC